MSGKVHLNLGDTLTYTLAPNSSIIHGGQASHGRCCTAGGAVHVAAWDNQYSCIACQAKWERYSSPMRAISRSRDGAIEVVLEDGTRHNLSRGGEDIAFVIGDERDRQLSVNSG